jgi:hypothetical protein
LIPSCSNTCDQEAIAAMLNTSKETVLRIFNVNPIMFS